MPRRSAKHLRAFLLVRQDDSVFCWPHTSSDTVELFLFSIENARCRAVIGLLDCRGWVGGTLSTLIWCGDVMLMRIFVCAVVLVMMQTAAHARRVARVIGQNAYSGGASATVGLPKLTNPTYGADRAADAISRSSVSPPAAVLPSVGISP